MKTNRQLVIEKLLEIANRMKDLRETGHTRGIFATKSGQPAPQITLAQLVEYDADSNGMPEEVYDVAFDVLADPEVLRVYGWLQCLAETSGFADVGEMLTAADITLPMLEQIYKLEINAPGTEAAPEPAPARIYKAILESMQNQIRERLSRMPAVIIRGEDAPIIDEMARTAAHSVAAELEV